MALRSAHAAGIVFLLSLAAFGFGVWRCGIAAAWVDPVARIAAQDEAVYSHSAMRMAAGDSWLSPKFLGRYALSKPPLLYWMMALPVKVFGASLVSLRLASLAAGAIASTLVFFWLWRLCGLPAGVMGLLLMLSDRLLHSLSRVAMTDALLTLWMVAAMTVLAFDPALRRRASPWIFGCMAGLAIMTKGIAGGLPLLALVVYWLAAPGRDRPGYRRIAVTLLAAFAVALPWHLYQFAAHPRWFWNEYVASERLAISIGSPEQAVEDPQLAFYAIRLWRTDPVLYVAVLLALPMWMMSIWKHTSPRAVALASWCAVTAGAVLWWDDRRAWYVLPLIPALALASVEFFPWRSRAGQTVAAAVLAIVFCGKVYAGGEIWGLPFVPDSPLASAVGLEQYCERHRTNDLVVVEPDDRFYASDLALAHVRYCYMRAPGRRRRSPLDLEYLGITVTAPQFDELGPDWQDVYRQRLEQWGLHSNEPLATAILARSPDEVEQMIASHPETDFSLPGSWMLNWPATHELWRAPGGRMFLLARKTGVAIPRPVWRCGF